MAYMEKILAFQSGSFGMKTTRRDTWTTNIPPDNSGPSEENCLPLFSHLAGCCHVAVALVCEVIRQGGGERDMNCVSQMCEVGMMRFTLREDNETDFLGRVAEEILQLPSVLRVRTNPARQEIEITFKQPAEGLLRQVNNALRLVGTEMTASKVR